MGQECNLLAAICYALPCETRSAPLWYYYLAATFTLNLAVQYVKAIDIVEMLVGEWSIVSPIYRWT